MEEVTSTRVRPLRLFLVIAAMIAIVAGLVALVTVVGAKAGAAFAAVGTFLQPGGAHYVLAAILLAAAVTSAVMVWRAGRWRWMVAAAVTSAAYCLVVWSISYVAEGPSLVNDAALIGLMLVTVPAAGAGLIGGLMGILYPCHWGLVWAGLLKDEE